MEIVKYNITDSAIAEIKHEYMPLRVEGIYDIDGFRKVVVARKVVIGKRIEVEAKRKSLKSESLKYGREVDTEAKRITALLAPIEAHLTQQEDVVRKEKERVKAEEQRLKQENHDNQLKQIIKAGAFFDGSAYCYDTSFITDSEIWLLTTEGFKFLIEKIELWKKRENIRIAEEDRVKKIESDRQAEIAKDQKIKQEELDRVARDQAEQANKLKDRQDKLDQEERERENQKNIDEAKIEAEKAAKIKFDENAKAESIRLENEKIESEKKEKEEKIREEKLRPDQEKIYSFVDTLLELIWPEVKSDEALEIIKEAMISMQDFTIKLRKEAILKL